ncbi:mono/diheme cytochrome c family protein [Pseudomonas fluvialis]|uniref:Mono/diheme cytochrome c family protein n=1 Tax=Pseudomonas fluvialis TaxID=1793966 RepID=A0A7X0BU82_9PSED|nr:cytochrome c [Pseudomonas fluvialis]MBB6342984.1 mono/diheme cytochrome c family protein [Pseudomonas fluvialis]
MHAKLLSSLLLLTALPLSAAELLLEINGQQTRYSTEQLLKQAQAIQITADIAYKRDMTYQAVPVASLLTGVNAGDQLQAVASDGFAAELPAAPLLNREGARAWVAIEDPAKPWPKLSSNKPSAGPFYLVWTDPQAGQIGPEQWPFQMVSLRQVQSLAERFPALLPAANAGTEVQVGFAQFQKHCLACHRLNGAGDSAFGPDLNIPHNPTEYFNTDYLPRYIRDPQSLRRWPQARMPGFSLQALADAELQQLLAYLRHMATRKAQL